MARKSRFKHLDSTIQEVVGDVRNEGKGPTALSKLVLGKNWTQGEVNSLRTYIKNHFINPTGAKYKGYKRSKVLIYDLETSRCTAKVWWTGKRYVGSNEIVEDPKIITVAWKWLGEDEVHHLTWDMKTHSDKKLVKEFCKVFNEADIVVGVNNKDFDDRWLAARAMKYKIPLNPYIKSYDIQKLAKKHFRLVGYSMKYLSKFADVTQKLSHEGIKMWDMVEGGTAKEQKEYMQKMINYNVGDIVTTELLYLRFLPYFKHQVHLGVMNGGESWSCPDTGSENVEYIDYTITGAGSIQRNMKSNETGRFYKISNRSFLKFML